MSAVFMAQVAKPMAAVRERGWNPSILVMAPVGEMFRPALRAKWRRQKEAVGHLGLNAARLPSPPSRYRSLWSDLPLLKLWLTRRFGRNPSVIMHCRGHLAAQLALDARATLPGIRVVFDLRGLNGEEYAYVRGYTSIKDAPEAIAQEARLVEKAEKAVAHGADHVICVSNAMKQVVSVGWKVSEDTISVVPCCTDTKPVAKVVDDREEIRQRLKFDDRLVVAYCGSLERWQVPETCLAWFKRIARIRSDAHLLAITTHPERMNGFADAAGIPESSRTVMSVRQDDVARFLAAADCGLLVRESSPVNQVASPVKFAEYLAVGVPVLISEGVGDYSEVVRSHGLGMVLPGSCLQDEGSERLQDFLSGMETKERIGLGKRCMEYAADQLDWAGTGDRLGWVYEILAD